MDCFSVYNSLLKCSKNNSFIERTITDDEEMDSLQKWEAKNVLGETKWEKVIHYLSCSSSKECYAAYLVGLERHCVLWAPSANQTLNSDKNHSQLDRLKDQSMKSVRNCLIGRVSSSIRTTPDPTSFYELDSWYCLAGMSFYTRRSHLILHLRIPTYFDRFEVLSLGRTWILWKPVKTT